ncbi:MAG: hypothetical protein IKH39_06615 [Candidatus Methanomethylophilaceae archaeon]|nr:hypothetical protein [Candidatus Methanomethylophilaceae archaeon]
MKPAKSGLMEERSLIIPMSRSLSLDGSSISDWWTSSTSSLITPISNEELETAWK